MLRILSRLLPCSAVRIGIDAGGTFTDFVVEDDAGSLSFFKIRSNPRMPAAVIQSGIEQAAGDSTEVAVVHGSTVATNALLERKGARTAFVTTEGFEDLLRIGRQNRPELYNLAPVLEPPLILPRHQFGLRERTLANGEVLRPLDVAALAAITQLLREEGTEAIALCLLHSYANAAHEEAALAKWERDFYVAASCRISPEFREYERAATTMINAYVGPLMQRYLDELARACRYPLAIMQSNGGFLTAAEAGAQAVRTILSGPAGGIIGATEVARQCGFRQALTFDMGGTSTDVSLVRAAGQFTTEGMAGGWPVRIPMLDIHTVGAGGGSIARVDAGGALRVGPESAGAEPGPACYGRGMAPTITDAHVVLRRIESAQFLDGGLPLDVARAEAAVQSIADVLGCTLVEAAEGMLRVGNASMERAIRVVSVERGEDARDFPLVAFGGCGGLHACEMAEELGIGTVIFPAFSGALSALGMLLADRTRDYSASARGRDAEGTFRELERRAQGDVPGAALERYADLRYVGQSYELTVPWRDAEQEFHAAHARVYGYSAVERPVESITLRVRAVLATPAPRAQVQVRSEEAPALRRVRVQGRWRRIPVYRRKALPDAFVGPALILDYGSTVLLARGWSGERQASGHVMGRRASR